MNTRKSFPLFPSRPEVSCFKCSHGNGGKLSPFLSPPEPCPANTHNTRVGTAAVLNVLYFLKILLFVCDVMAMLCTSAQLMGRNLLPLRAG